MKRNEAITKLHKILVGVPQGSVLGPLLYLFYTADLPIKTGTTTGTFADDTVVPLAHQNPITAAMLQSSLNGIEAWFKKWRIKANESKSVQVTFTTKHKLCPPVFINDAQIPQANEVKSRDLPGQVANMEKTYLHQTKTTEPGVEEELLVVGT